MITKLASAIYNDIVAGLVGYTSTPTISLEQLEDEIVEERLLVIKEYGMRNMLPRKDLYMSINCIPVDCKSLDKCPCGKSQYSEPIAHFEIPQLVNGLPDDAIEFVGSVDRQVQFKVYDTTAFQYHKFMRRGANKPYVYIEPTPNENNKYDGWVFNSPLLEVISVIGIFKDPRQVAEFDCCADDDIENYTFISTEVKKRLTEKKLRYYRQFYGNPQPNNQAPK